jgi:hypothetical protein
MAQVGVDVRLALELVVHVALGEPEPAHGGTPAVVRADSAHAVAVFVAFLAAAALVAVAAAAVLARLRAVPDVVVARRRLTNAVRAHAAVAARRLDARRIGGTRRAVAATVHRELAGVEHVVPAGLAQTHVLEALTPEAVFGLFTRLPVPTRAANTRAVHAGFPELRVEQLIPAMRLLVRETVFGYFTRREHAREQAGESKARGPRSSSAGHQRRGA